MDADQLDDPVLYRQELIKTHSRRLKALEIKASKYGLECPVSIEVEITEIKENIAALGGEIDDLTRYRRYFTELERQQKEAKDNRKLLLHELLKQGHTNLKYYTQKIVKQGGGLKSFFQYNISNLTDLMKRIEKELASLNEE